MKSPTPICRTDVFGLAPPMRFQWEEAQRCYVLLYPEGMVRLNASAGEIIRRLDGTRSVEAILRELEEAFPEAPELESDVMAMLEAAHERGWIERRA